MSEPKQPPPAGKHPVQRIKAGLGHAWTLLFNSVRGLFFHRGTQLAASMSYYALFSVFPAAIVIAAVAGFVLDDPDARQGAVDYLVRELPLTEDQGRSDIETVLDGVAANSGTLGLIGLVGLLISASALMSSARNALDIIFGDDVRRGALRGKGLDLLIVFGLGLLFAASFALTLLTQLNIGFSGSVGDAVEQALRFTGNLLPLFINTLVFSILYRVLPTERPSLRDVWPGVVFAAIVYELVKRGFSFYLDKFADYSAVYGSLGAVIAFMFFLYLAGIVFLIGAEMAAIWPAVRRGEYDGDPDEEGEPFSEQLRGAVMGLFRRNRVDR